MGILKNFTGIIGNLFQIGGATGPQLKNNSGVIEAKNSDDNALVILRCLAPVGDTDVTNKYYVDSLEKPLIVKRQANCSAALPANTAARGWVVVSTAGTGAVIGDILYDDGTSVGNMVIVAAVEGRTIVITDALSGGTVIFQADTMYIWDADGSLWFEISTPAGTVKEIRFAITNAASQDSIAQIPANAIIRYCWVKVVTPYSAGATITVGSTSTATLCQATTDNTATIAGIYVKDQDSSWEAAASVVRVAVANIPAAGAGFVIVGFVKPLV